MPILTFVSLAGIAAWAVVCGLVGFADQLRPAAAGAAADPVPAARGRWGRGYRVAVTALHADIAALAIGMVVWDGRLMSVTAALAVALLGAAGVATAVAKEGDVRALVWAGLALALLGMAFHLVPGGGDRPC